MVRSLTLIMEDERPVVLDLDAVVFIIPDDRGGELVNVHFSGREGGVTVRGSFKDVAEQIFGSGAGFLQGKTVAS